MKSAAGFYPRIRRAFLTKGLHIPLSSTQFHFAMWSSPSEEGGTLLQVPFPRVLAHPDHPPIWDPKSSQIVKNNMFWGSKKSSKTRPFNFHLFLPLFEIFNDFSTNCEAFWVNPGASWASFFDVSLGNLFCSVFCAIFSHISKNAKIKKCLKHCPCA